jgi:arsenate reductase (thioredoxin)
MSARDRVLFVCIRNSARSQMAEGFLNAMCGERFVAESAGLEPGTLNPLAVAAMAEVGIDISHKGTQSVFDLFKSGHLYSYVVTVCDGASAELCPIFPGIVKRMHWGIPDPAIVEGTYDDRMRAFRETRDEIRAKVDEFCGVPCQVEKLIR